MRRCLVCPQISACDLRAQSCRGTTVRPEDRRAADRRIRLSLRPCPKTALWPAAKAQEPERPEQTARLRPREFGRGRAWWWSAASASRQGIAPTGRPQPWWLRSTRSSGWPVAQGPWAVLCRDPERRSALSFGQQQMWRSEAPAAWVEQGRAWTEEWVLERS